MKRTLSLFLSACLLAGILSGCSNPPGNGSEKPTGETPMGRYVEEQGEILENMRQVYDFKSTGDGGFTFYGSIPLDDYSGKADFNLYTVPAGSGPITSEKVPGLTEFAPTGVRDMARGADGTLYILYYADNSLRTSVAKSVNGGPFEPIEVPDMATPTDIGIMGPGSSISIGGSGSVSVGASTIDEDDDASADGGTPAPTETPTGDAPVVEGAKSYSFSEGDIPAKMASGIRALDDGFLVLYGVQGVSRYAADGTLKGEFSGTAYGFSTYTDGTTLLLGNSDSTALWSYDLATVKQGETYTFDNFTFTTRAYMDAENLYLADSTGIYRQAKGSTLWEKLVDGDLTSLVMPNLTISGFAADGNGGFGALLAAQDSMQFMRYAFSADTPTNPDTELSIFSLRDNNTVRQAIGEFQRRNPNVRVNFRVGMDDSSSATAEDIVRTLNTELLAGKGPDLILLDGLNMDSYIDKGVLLDLTDFVKGQTGLLSNLTNAYEKDGELYGVPSRFTFPVMMGSAADVDGMNSLQTLVDRVVRDQGGDTRFLRPSSELWSENGVEDLMDYYDAIAGGIVKDDGKLDEAALTAFFSAIQTLDKTLKQYTPQSDGSVAFVTMAISGGGAGGYEEINMGPSDLKEGKALFHTQEMAGIFALTFVSQNLSGLENQKLAPIFNSNAYTPKGGIGVNAAGKQQELALSFLEMLLSTTVQDNYLYDGYPVNSSSLDKLVADNLKGENDMGFLAMCKTLNAPLRSDAVIRDAVRAQMKGLMDGSATPEQAAASVVEKTQLYLAE